MPISINAAKSLVNRAQAHTELVEMTADALKANGQLVSHSITPAGKDRVLIVLLYTVEL